MGFDKEKASHGHGGILPSRIVTTNVRRTMSEEYVNRMHNQG